MTRIALSLALAIAALALPLSAAAASLTRTFVSSAGLDTNPCTVTAPCRTFAGAYANTAANGIIAALDPADYGSLTITGPVTVDGNGWAAITAPNNGNGITINAGASDTVILRGLTVDGAGTGSFGIIFFSGASLTVEDCVVRNVMSDGLAFTPAATATLAVSNSLFVDNEVGVFIDALSGAATASIDRSEFANNVSVGLDLVADEAGSLTVAVMDGAANANNGIGVKAASMPPNNPAVTLTLTRFQVSNNSFGVASSGTHAAVWLAQSTITGNSFGFSIQSGAVINSFGDNYFADNVGNAGSLTPVSKQ